MKRKQVRENGLFRTNRDRHTHTHIHIYAPLLALTPHAIADAEGLGEEVGERDIREGGASVALVQQRNACALLLKQVPLSSHKRI